MVVIDKNKCRGCGDCIKICHEDCMMLEDDKIKINFDYCSECAQCIAICSKQALSWDNIPSRKFSSASFPGPEQIDELLGQRRTIRHFKKEKPPNAVVEEIINYGILAPSHHHEFRILIIEADGFLELIDNTVYKYNQKIYRFLYKPKLIQQIIKLISGPYQYKEYTRARPKIENSIKIGKAYSNLPPVIVLLIARKNLPLSVESAQYILYNIILYGMTKGIGSRLLVGNQMFLNKNHRLKKHLGISNKENIYGTLGIGYPEVKFRNKVLGKKFDIQWNTNIH